MDEDHADKLVLQLLHPTEDTLQSLLNRLNSAEMRDEHWFHEFLQAKGLEVRIK